MPEFKKIRESLGLTISGMARALEVHRNTYDKWERGEHPPPAIAVRFMQFLYYQNRKHRPAMVDTLKNAG